MFLLRTDHGSLRWQFGFKDPEVQMARWLERSARFNFIKHRPGRKRGNSYGLRGYLVKEIVNMYERTWDVREWRRKQNNTRRENSLN